MGVMTWRVFRLELMRRQVIQVHVRADGVVMLSPSFDDRHGFGAGAGPLDTQAFITELAVDSTVPFCQGLTDHCYVHCLSQRTENEYFRF